jgi:hypothetical protein
VRKRFSVSLQQEQQFPYTANISSRNSWYRWRALARVFSRSLSLRALSIRYTHSRHHELKPSVWAFTGGKYTRVGSLGTLQLEQTFFPSTYRDVALGIGIVHPVYKSAAVRPTNKLTFAFAGGESGSFRSRKGSCGVRERPAKETRQESQQLCFDSSRKYLQFVGQDYLRHHILKIAQTVRPLNPMRRWVSGHLWPKNGRLRLRLGGLQKSAPSGDADFKERLLPKQLQQSLADQSHIEEK